MAARGRAEHRILDAGGDVELGQVVSGHAVHRVEVPADEHGSSTGRRGDRLHPVVQLGEEVRVDASSRPVEGEQVGLVEDRRAALVLDLGEGAAHDDRGAHRGDRAHLPVEHVRGVVGRIRRHDDGVGGLHRGRRNGREERQRQGQQPTDEDMPGQAVVSVQRVSPLPLARAPTLGHHGRAYARGGTGPTATANLGALFRNTVSRIPPLGRPIGPSPGVTPNGDDRSPKVASQLRGVFFASNEA